MIDIMITNSVLELGEKVSGGFSCNLQQTAPKSVLISVGWRTEGRGNVDRKKVSETSLKLSYIRSTDFFPFEFQIPFERPISYDGKLIRIIWEITVEIDAPKKSKQTAIKQSMPFRVLPRNAGQ